MIARLVCGCVKEDGSHPPLPSAAPVQLIPMGVRHPLESFLGPTFLELFANPRNRKAQAVAGKPAKAMDVGDAAVSRSGGHAVYMTWLLGDKAQPRPTCSCFGPRKVDPILAGREAIVKTLSAGLEFSRFRNLPLNKWHRFYQEFGIRRHVAWGIPAISSEKHTFS